MNISDLHRRVIGSAPKQQLLLDEFPNAAGAYSLRLLSSSYTGNCIEVRRSSDNALQNIGFVNGVLDTASLLSFVGAGNGFVRTWYDQSGNVRNASNTTNTQQPRIVNAGILDVFNNIPVVRNPNANALIRLSISFSALQPLPFTVIFAGKIDQRSTNISIYFGGSANAQLGGRYNLVCNDSFFQARRQNEVTPQVILNTAIFNTNAFIQQGIFRISQIDGRQNGTDSTPVNYFGDVFSLTSSNITLIGSTTTNTLFPAISAYEYIFYLSDQYSNRINIESNINDYYNIF
jgi:hypothetical protein